MVGARGGLGRRGMCSARGDTAISPIPPTPPPDSLASRQHRHIHAVTACPRRIPSSSPPPEQFHLELSSPIHSLESDYPHNTANKQTNDFHILSNTILTRARRPAPSTSTQQPDHETHCIARLGLRCDIRPLYSPSPKQHQSLPTQSISQDSPEISVESGIIIELTSCLQHSAQPD